MSARRWAPLLVALLATGGGAGVAASTGSGSAAAAPSPKRGGSARAPAMAMRPWRRGHVVAPAGGLAGPAIAAAPPSGPAGSAPGSPAPTAGTAPTSPSTAPSTSTPPAPQRRAGAELNEFTVRLTRTILDAGLIEITATNYGMDEHDLTVSRSGTIRARTGLIAPRDDKTLTFTATPGTYKVYCSILDGAHDDAGMNTTLTVR